jgi:hypothetical protein
MDQEESTTNSRAPDEPKTEHWQVLLYSADFMMFEFPADPVLADLSRRAMFADLRMRLYATAGVRVLEELPVVLPTSDELLATCRDNGWIKETKAADANG